MWSLNDFVNFWEVFVIGFVATTKDEYDIVIWEGVDGDAGRRGVGGEIVVVILYAV